MTVPALDLGTGSRVVADRTPLAVARLQALAGSHWWGWQEWDRPGPSAAFSRRDVQRPGFAEAAAALEARGFTPFVRPVGGHLAAYHEGALVLDVFARIEDPRPGTTARFRVVAEAIARGLRRLGVDARTGGVPGEYCPGDWSVNAGGVTKLVGTGQRLVRGAALVTAVIVVGDTEPLAEAMMVGYGHLGLSFDPRTVGSIAEHVPGVTLADVEDAVGRALADSLALDGPDLCGGRTFLHPWDPR